MVIIKELLLKGTDILKNNVENPRFEAECLLCEILEKDRLWLSVHRDDHTQTDIEQTFISYCKRRSLGEPLAYITGKKEFMSLEFIVNPNVLIPRAETELLCEEIISRHSCENVKILDICTGSGAIACSLAHYIENSSVWAIDISPEALSVAKMNALQTVKEKKIEFLCMNALEKITLDEKFDIVVSNPPYIESEIIETLDITVRDHEPHLALDGGKDGLIFYESIVHNIDSILKPSGRIYFEIGYNQGEALKNIMNDKFYDICVIKDLAGLDRIVTGQLA